MSAVNLVYVKGAYVPKMTRPTRHFTVPDTTSDFATVPTSRILTHSDDNSTLTTSPDIYYVNLTNYNGFTVILPPVDEMENRQLTFIVRSNVQEAWFVINGPIHDSGSSYTLAGSSSVTILSDGTKWWVIASSSV